MHTVEVFFSEIKKENCQYITNNSRYSLKSRRLSASSDNSTNRGPGTKKNGTKLYRLKQKELSH